MLMVWVRTHGWVVVSCLGLALLRRMVEGSAGWESCPPQVGAVAEETKACHRYGDFVQSVIQ